MLVPLGDSYMRHAGPARRSRFTGTSAPHPQGQARISQRGPCRSTITASPGRFKYAVAFAREFTLALIVKALFLIIGPPKNEWSAHAKLLLFLQIRGEFFGQRRMRSHVTHRVLRSEGPDGCCILYE